MLTGEAGRPTTASASVAVITVTGTAKLNAAAKPKSEKAPRREIISDLIFSPITASACLPWLPHCLSLSGRKTLYLGIPYIVSSALNGLRRRPPRGGHYVA